MLILMLQYCTENGYLATAEKLQQEAGFAISKFEVVENIDLLRIIQVDAFPRSSPVLRDAMRRFSNGSSSPCTTRDRNMKSSKR